MRRETLEKFVGYIESQKQDRKVMAAFRRAVNEETEVDSWKYILPWCNCPEQFVEKEKDVLKIVAIAYAVLGSDDKQEYANLGDVFRKLSALFSSESIDVNFKQLIECRSRKELIVKLNRVISLCKSKNVPINLINLGMDVDRWEKYRNEISINWATRYYK